MLKPELIYMLSLIHSNHNVQLIGVFLDVDKMKTAKNKVLAAGVDESSVITDVAPIGIIDLYGVEQPYTEGLVN